MGKKKKRVNRILQSYRLNPNTLKAIEEMAATTNTSRTRAVENAITSYYQDNYTTNSTK